MEKAIFTFKNKEVAHQWNAGKVDNLQSNTSGKVNRATETRAEGVQRSTRSKSGLSFIFNN